MKGLHLRIPSREHLMAGLGPAVVAVLVLALFVVPNYLRAAEARRDSLRVGQSTSDHLMKRSQLVALERDLARLRAERTIRCRVIGDIADDRLLDTVAATIDAHDARNQGTRILLPERLAKDASRQLDLVRRGDTVDMIGSFDAVFAVLQAAEQLDQLVVPMRLEIGAIRSASPDEPVNLRVTLELHSYFRPSEATP